ncbi:MAG TPA: phosphopantetheine-binding protein [Kofleriaceae bacterium]|nr:phosphopantetheine-binding protein [Kofleriaceae bacterium]
MTTEENRTTLLREVKQLIVDALQLDDVQPDSIADDEPLFGTGLALDSIDALELAMAITRRYAVKMSQGEETRDAFRSVGHLVDYILLHAA